MARRRGVARSSTAVCEGTDDGQAVREHATAGGFPVTHIREIGSVIDPMTGA